MSHPLIQIARIALETKPIAYQGVAERFWEKVTKTRTCWLWSGACDSDGRGVLGIGKGSRRLEKAPRVSWVLHFGPIPEGLWVLHRCDIPACVKPTHLFLGTQSDNMSDCSRKGRLRIPYHRGSEIPWAKLTEEDIPSIRKMVRSGVSFREIGAYFGVHNTAISHIIQGRNWKHVP